MTIWIASWLFLVVRNNAAIEHSCAGFCVDVCFTSLGCMPKSRIAGSYSNFIFIILRNWQTVFQSGCPILQSHQQCMSVTVSPHPCQHLPVFFILTTLVGVKWHPLWFGFAFSWLSMMCWIATAAPTIGVTQPQIEWLKQQKCILSQFWRLEVQDEGVQGCFLLRVLWRICSMPLV